MKTLPDYLNESIKKTWNLEWCDEIFIGKLSSLNTSNELKETFNKILNNNKLNPNQLSFLNKAGFYAIYSYDEFDEDKNPNVLYVGKTERTLLQRIPEEHNASYTKIAALECGDLYLKYGSFSNCLNVSEKSFKKIENCLIHKLKASENNNNETAICDGVAVINNNIQPLIEYSLEL